MLKLYRKKKQYDIVVYMGGYRCKVECSISKKDSLSKESL